MKVITLSTIVALLLLGVFAGCDTSPRAKDGDKVKVHYTGTLEDGSEFDSSRGSEPLEFTLGAPGLIQGFQDGVRGMAVGETKTVTMTPEQAYGMPRPEMIQQVPRSMLPEDMEPTVGEQLTMQAPNGRPMPVTVTAFDDSTMTLDANHPLAGKTLTFELELVEIVAPDSEG